MEGTSEVVKPHIAQYQTVAAFPGMLFHTDPADWAELVCHAEEPSSRRDEADPEHARVSIKVMKYLVTTMWHVAAGAWLFMKTWPSRPRVPPA